MPTKLPDSVVITNHSTLRAGSIAMEIYTCIDDSSGITTKEIIKQKYSIKPTSIYTTLYQLKKNKWIIKKGRKFYSTAQITPIQEIHQVEKKFKDFIICFFSKSKGKKRFFDEFKSFKEVEAKKHELCNRNDIEEVSVYVKTAL